MQSSLNNTGDKPHASYLGRLSDWLLNSNASGYLFYMMVALLLFVFLGNAELWTQEGRWAVITHEMLLRHDYLHPYLISAPYYDKPLLSYWLILLIRPFTGGLTELSLRLPSAIAALISLGCCYTLIGKNLNRQTARLCVWMLLTTFYFVFWARVASADMLSTAGILLSVTYYYQHRLASLRYYHYLLFFSILAIACLFKGIVAGVVVGLIILPDLFIAHTWRKHTRLAVLGGVFTALIIYFIPFILSNLHGLNYNENGLYQVFRENIIRYIHPYDQIRPFYLYFLYLPIYMLPWAVLLPFMIVHLYKQYKNQSDLVRWLIWASVLVFLFFTGSGSRRSYYILPLVPFVTMLCAIWLGPRMSGSLFWKKTMALLLLTGLGISIVCFIILKPILYYNSTQRALGKEVNVLAANKAPWSQWQIVRVNNALVKTFYYLSPAKPVKSASIATLPAMLAKSIQTKMPLILVTNMQDSAAVQAIVDKFRQQQTMKQHNVTLHVIREAQISWTHQNRHKKIIVFILKVS